MTFRRSLSFAAVVLATAGFAAGQTRHSVVAYPGQPIVGGGVITAPDVASLDPAGNVGFSGSFHTTPDAPGTGIFFAADGLIHRLAGPDPVPGDPTVPFGVGATRIDGAGHVFFGGWLPLTQQPPPGVTDEGDAALFVASPGRRERLVREGDRAPGTPDGVHFTGLLEREDGEAEVAGGFGPVAAAADRRFAFVGTLGGPGVPLNQRAVFSGTPGDFTLVARSGEPAPGGGSFRPNFLLSNNAAGHVLLQNYDQGVHALYAGAPGALRLVARRGDPVPGAGGLTFADLGDASLNDAGGVAFAALLPKPPVGDEYPFAQALFVATAAAPPRLVVRAGDPAPGTGTTFFHLGSPNLTASGRFAFLGTAEFRTGYPYRWGIWSGTPDDFHLLVMEGQPAPGTGGRLFAGSSVPIHIGLNEAGQIAFAAGLEPDRPDQLPGRGLWLTGADGLPLLIARTGETLDLGDGTGRLVQQVALQGLNDSGQLLYRLDFADRTSALLIATVPEPALLTLSLLAPLLLARRRRRTGHNPAKGPDGEQLSFIFPPT